MMVAAAYRLAAAASYYARARQGELPSLPHARRASASARPWRIGAAGLQVGPAVPYLFPPVAPNEDRAASVQPPR